MKIIKCLSEKIREELADAEAYIDLALEWKSEQPETAELFSELSAEEMGHMSRLHDHVQKLIEDYREKNGEPQKVMLAVYDYMHQEHIKDAMRIKVKQGMFRE